MRRSFRWSDFPAPELVEAKGSRTISVVIPARNEEATVGSVVAEIRRRLVEAIPLVDEILVVDDCSSDRTAERAWEAGAVVIATTDVLADHPAPGKGQAMWKGVYAARGDLIVFLDADVTDFDTAFVTGLVGPLLARNDVDMVKGYYERPLAGRPGEGGRVTELAARPLLSVFFPHLTDLHQPLSGECAAWREVFESLPFVGGYGVDIGLLIDVTARLGNQALVQSDLGSRVHRNRPLSDLGPQALAILQVVLTRAGLDEHAARATLRRPVSDPLELTFAEMPPLEGIAPRRKSA